MSEIENEKKLKRVNVKSQFVSIRVTPETKKKILRDLQRINKEKEFGRRIRSDAYIALAIELFEPKHFEKLKESSMTNHDRLELAFQSFSKETGSNSKDEFFGLLLKGQLSETNGNSSLNSVSGV